MHEEIQVKSIRVTLLKLHWAFHASIFSSLVVKSRQMETSSNANVQQYAPHTTVRDKSRAWDIAAGGAVVLLPSHIPRLNT